MRHGAWPALLGSTLPAYFQRTGTAHRVYPMTGQAKELVKSASPLHLDGGEHVAMAMDDPPLAFPAAARPRRTFMPRDYGFARELALRVVMCVAARRGRLRPDVLLGDGAVAPLRHGHHPGTVLELADHAGPVS